MKELFWAITKTIKTIVKQLIGEVTSWYHSFRS